VKGEIRLLAGFDDADAEIKRDFEESIAKPLDP
jgi:hypothetical protein